MSKIKQGDRVRLKTTGYTFDGYKGTVTAVLGPLTDFPLLQVRMDKDVPHGKASEGKAWACFPEDVRRLVKKRRK